MEADLVITNGKVLTVDKDFNIRQAVAVKDGLIVAVGTNDEVKPLISSSSRMFNPQGGFDVRGSSFKTTLYGVNVTIEYLHKNLALMGLHPNWDNEKSSLRDQKPAYLFLHP